ncbi:class I SAM-dependent methyltransferase [Endozoicomonas sp. SM1973]|uniref:Class I SAM-dependent methyltransferase n=1 Tax=Spartinivicinus marinus TaxID=2994442 RepID=A0A853I0W5_9GAMM|nr:class I SAM-dependent methyltransferase [Spartinivicinus marinus]MCX4028807.1 class I SAM-dependent methyltransferase [Spartinivicinus marinus]NYZ67620.1 class I SAM-dependent methyltransferase [Spartinivicinus marinus]
MNSEYTSLPAVIDQSIKDGTCLVGDNFNDDQLKCWFLQEKEAFFEGDAGNSEIDPWYEYMHYVNECLGFEHIIKTKMNLDSILVLGPGAGKEIEKFSKLYKNCTLNFLEASENFQKILQKRFHGSNIIFPKITGDIELDDNTQNLVCAFSVLHHIPNVSKVIEEVARVVKIGGYFLVREPCSSMGDWRYPRSATPNERGISRNMMVNITKQTGFILDKRPIPIIFEPLNKVLKKTIGFRMLPYPMLYKIDRIFSWLISYNDHYWRDSWYKKIGPSSYFYIFRKIF